jgi:hypothetical protein
MNDIDNEIDGTLSKVIDRALDDFSVTISSRDINQTVEKKWSRRAVLNQGLLKINLHFL